MKTSNFRTIRANHNRLVADHTQKLRPLKELAKRLRKTYPSLSREKRFYCYVYLDPRHNGSYEYTLPSGKNVAFNHKPFYVGKGCYYRAYEHIRLVRNNRDPKDFKSSVIRKILLEGMEPIVKITASRRDEAYALAFELDLIQGIGKRTDKTGPLTNLSEGGFGGSGVKRGTPSAETRRKIGDANRGRVHPEGSLSRRLGRVMSQKTRELLSKANRGYKHTDEALRKMRDARAARSEEEVRRIYAKAAATKRGHEVSEETRAKISAANARRTPAERKRISEAIRKAKLEYWARKRELQDRA